MVRLPKALVSVRLLPSTPCSRADIQRIITEIFGFRSSISAAEQTHNNQSSINNLEQLTQLNTVDGLEATDRPDVIGFQADMAHTLLYTMGYNAPEARLLPEGYDWRDGAELDAALRKLTDALRPWTIDFHVAQNDGTVFGSGSHDKTGRHCMAADPMGKLDIPRHAGFWLRDADGDLTKAFQHICWDGCMFPNAELMKPATWNGVLAAMIKVRDAHGWSD